ncbi:MULTISPECIES: SDR family oxidoreductase [unclassified Mycobacterium]|uniref:SDR family NAD(P)-dependent oxidoreductase n=1 Tax=unclassified Mycobacterium TaxID=2642494 RepID=UPI00073FEEAD|nr:MULTISPECIES: SDR family oxidoreductase [unclassified Mycobacterium]KUH80740.1 short-chain dehydrogenase [Mycobacterium sp. GA-0227b]KUH92464.1 short-chain dehydrogenase [Mycobacterium sp. GA-1999]KUH92948.1 short-chain dehydrogenase [Mycobacterium sp. IS-1556]
MTSSPPLRGRGAVVVGGSRGLGLAVAELLAAHGAGVIVNGRDADAVTQAAQRILNARGLPGSPADPAVADSLIDMCVQEFGQIDILINCAGTAEPHGSSILNVTSAQFRDLIDAHLGTVFETCRAAAPKMVAQGGGAIVNTSSFAFLGDYGGTGYPAGKGGVNGLTLAIAAELKGDGVRANVVCPGARTRLSTGPEYEAHINDLHRRGLLDEMSMQGALDAAPPEYVAPTYAYLASDLAANVTGQIFIAAGGFVGRFDRPTPTILAYRDHHDSPPWSVSELDGVIHRGGDRR